MREHESAVKRQRRMKTLLKHFAGKAARGLEGKWKEGEALDPSLEAALARELSEGKGRVEILLAGVKVSDRRYRRN
jgi:hypothetical protein